MLKTFAAGLLDLVVPPRETELIVRALTQESLCNLQSAEGLPYKEDAVRALVWEIKYYAHARAAGLAGELLAPEVAALASEEIGTPLLIPVPMHTHRRRQRGHNQTEVLCEVIIRILARQKNLERMSADATVPEVGKFPAENFPRSREVAFAELQYAPRALERIVNTPTQQGLERTKRLKNVAGSMRADARVKDRVCIVVDDVATTGATLAEAKRALRAAGAHSVHCVALAYS